MINGFFISFLSTPFHPAAVVVSLKSILVVELFGLDKLTNAFGHMLVLQGVASIAGAIIGGTFSRH